MHWPTQVLDQPTSWHLFIVECFFARADRWEKKRKCARLTIPKLATRPSVLVVWFEVMFARAPKDNFQNGTFCEIIIRRPCKAAQPSPIAITLFYGLRDFGNDQFFMTNLPISSWRTTRHLLTRTQASRPVSSAGRCLKHRIKMSTLHDGAVISAIFVYF